MTDKCPSGYAWDERLKVCVEEVKYRASSSDSHFGRNVLTLLIGFLVGLFGLWAIGWLVIIPFALLLAYLLFAGNDGLKFPIIGFIIGIIISYWSLLMGIWHALTSVAGVAG
jgi:hypothetical protein